jgi:hypothetical protein
MFDRQALPLAWLACVDEYVLTSHTTIQRLPLERLSAYNAGSIPVLCGFHSHVFPGLQTWTLQRSCSISGCGSYRRSSETSGVTRTTKRATVLNMHLKIYSPSQWPVDSIGRLQHSSPNIHLIWRASHHSNCEAFLFRGLEKIPMSQALQPGFMYWHSDKM